MKKTRRNGVRGFLTLLLVLVALVVLGPPALGALAAALGIAISVAAVGLKVGLVVLAVWAVIALFRAVFGKSAPTPELPKGRPAVETDESIDAIAARLEREESEQRAALDRQLDEALGTNVS